MARLVDVALALPTSGTFQYSIPETMQAPVEAGQRVFAAVRSRRMVGYVVGVSDVPLGITAD